MPSMPHSLDADDLRSMIRDQIEKIGCTQAEYAQLRGISESHLSRILSGEREPCGQLLKDMGMKRCVYYEWIEE